MSLKKMIGTFLSLTLACGVIHASDLAFRPFPAAAENQRTVLLDADTENPFDKQDDKEVPYDRTRWIQPPEWNCPKLDPRDYDGGIMLYFDKIGLEPELSAGEVQRIYCSLTGVTEPVSHIKFHVFYDTRLKVKPNDKGEVMNAGKCLGGFTTGCAMIEEGQLVFYAYSPEDILLQPGSVFTIDFIVPEDAGPGECYPIGISYVDDGIAYDTFLNSVQDDAGKLQMAYLFTRGIYNGYIKMNGEKITTTSTTPAPPEGPLWGDVNGDGGISVADAVLLCRIAAEDPCDGITLTEENLFAADYDDDGLITMLDAAEMLAYLQTYAADT